MSTTLSTTLSSTARFIPKYWITMRPYLLFVSGITGMCGASYSLSFAGWPAVLLFGAFFLSYGFGQALTDCFQMDTDSLSSPYRPLVMGTLRRTDVMIVSLLGLTACGVIFVAFSPLNIFLALLAVGGLATYTYFKKRWWGGPFYNAWIVVVLFFIGVQSGAMISLRRDLLSLMPSVLAVFFGYANFVLTGYFKDVEADRQTGYNTLLVVRGRKISSLVSDVFSFLFSIGGAVAVLSAVARRAIDSTSAIAITLLISGVSLALYSQFKLHHVTDDRHAYVAIIPCVHAYIMLLAAIAIANQPAWMFPLVGFIAMYFVTIFSRPEQSQI